MTYSRDTLVAALRDQGITYLAPSNAQPSETIPHETALITALLEQKDSRLKLALVNMLLRHPELAQTISKVADQLEPPLQLDLQTFYMAAVYLQRLWRSRLTFYLGQFPLLPDLYSTQLELPDANERFGKVGLYALADAWMARSPYPFNRLASLNNTIDLFFEQLKIERRHHESQTS